ncbi:hypothetical protein Fcan01_11258, partial [Folsomia candida]
TYHDAVAKLGAVVRESDAELTSDADKSRRRAKKNSSSDEDGHSDGSFKTKRVSSPPKFHLTLVNPETISKKATKSIKKTKKDAASTSRQEQVIANDQGPSREDTSESHPLENKSNVEARSPTVYDETCVTNCAGNGEDVSSLNASNPILGGSQFEKYMVRNIAILKAQIRQLQESLDAILVAQQVKTPRIARAKVEHDLPLKTKEEVDKLELHYKSDDKKQTLIIELGHRARGNNPKCTRKVLSNLCDDKLAEHYNWIGSRGEKYAFRESWMNEIVLDAVRRSCTSNSVTDTEIEEITKTWLKNAPKRIKKSSKKIARAHNGGEGNQNGNLQDDQNESTD